MPTKHHYVFTYDIADNKRRAKVARELENWGARVNLSVFECWLIKSELEGLLTRLTTIIDKRKDILIVYPLCLNCLCAMRSLGRRVVRRMDQPVLFV